ncbi:MAG: hypothetical protein BroJett024_20980 [Alphaproteobacteria bacterium]|nr:MAG: hypothetical protein BroJett024_20980 [Alphaproteobacteria bacterium]
MVEADKPERLARIERLARNLGYERHVFQHGQARYEIVELKYEADVLAAISRQLSIIGVDEVVISPPGLARRWSIKSAEYVQKGRFAGAGGTEQHHELALEYVEIDVPQSMNFNLSHQVGLAKSRGVKHGRLGREK